MATPGGSRLVGVAVSGGRDSMALLHAVAAQAADLGVEVHALHVHHGLQPSADHWWRHVEQACQRWARKGWPITFQGARITTSPQPAESIEAFARRERYAALTRMAKGLGILLVLLAHHRRDQAETFLLQALRGAGPAGLASMPHAAERGGITWIRPWLAQPPEAIETYARRHRLPWVEDPSNRDQRYARSRLRQHVMPSLESAFDHATASLCAAAQRVAEARGALQEVAVADLSLCAEAEGLHVQRWQALSQGRRLNALRHWLDARVHQVPQTLIERLLLELRSVGRATWPCNGGTLELHRGVLHMVPATPATPAPDILLRLSAAGRHEVPSWGGALTVQRTTERGVPLSMLTTLELRHRRGGEAFQRELNTPARSLKKQYQDADVAPWLRDGPLIYSGERLLYVPGLGLDARNLENAAPRKPVMMLRWERRAVDP
jgi:tRNA(Ile)-lysidine synthase